MKMLTKTEKKESHILKFSSTKLKSLKHAIHLVLFVPEKSGEERKPGEKENPVKNTQVSKAVLQHCTL